MDSETYEKIIEELASWMTANLIFPVTIDFKTSKDGKITVEIEKIWKTPEWTKLFIEKTFSEKSKRFQFEHPDELPYEAPSEHNERSLFAKTLLRHWVLQGKPVSMAELSREYGIPKSVLYNESSRIQKGGLVRGEEKNDATACVREV